MGNKEVVEQSGWRRTMKRAQGSQEDAEWS